MEKVVWGYFQGKQSLFKYKDHHYKPSYTKSLKKNTQYKETIMEMILYFRKKILVMETGRY